MYGTSETPYTVLSGIDLLAFCVTLEVAQRLLRTRRKRKSRLVVLGNHSPTLHGELCCSKPLSSIRLRLNSDNFASRSLTVRLITSPECLLLTRYTDSLFADKASSERKLWGFGLLSWAIRTAPADLLSALFTPKFLRTLTNHRAEQGRDLFHAAEGPLDAITDRAERDTVAALKLFQFLVSSEVPTQFDAATKSSTLSRVAGNIPEDGRSEMLDAIQACITKPALVEDDSNAIDAAQKARIVSANLLVSMVARHAKHHESVDDDFTRRIVQSLAFFAYLKTKDALPPVSEDSRSMFHDAIIRSMNHILPNLAQPGQWFVDVVQYVQKSSKSPGHKLAIQAEDSIKDVISAAHTTMKDIRKSLDSATDSLQEPLKIMQLLFSLTLLEAYSGDADAIDMLSELQACYASIDEQETQTQAFDLLVELLLSFLPKTSSLYRQVGDFVFPVLAGGMSSEGLESLLDILSTKESAAGQGELFDPADAHADDEDDEDMDDMSIDSDVEILEPSDDEGVKNGQEGSGQEIDDEDDQDDSEDPELQQFNEMLAQTLKTAATKGDTADDGSSDDESDMDDEQMMALDPQLTKIFQERRKAAGVGDSGSKKKERSKAKLQVTLFKSRVLDLLQTYVKKQHAQPIVFQVLMPLLSLMRTTTNSELEKKAKMTLGTWFDNCDRNKEYPVAADIETTWVLLRAVHDEVQKPASKQHTMICGRASLFIAKLLMLNDRSNIKRLVEEYGKTQIQVIENGTNVQAAFFTEWCGWCMQWKNATGKQENNETLTVIQGLGTGPTAATSDVQPVLGTSGAEKAGKKQSKKSKKQNRMQEANGTTS